jgi:hypothetical protein
MAIVSDNLVTSGLRGKFGEFFVFRKLRGKTVVTLAPGKQDKRKETAAQRGTRTAFAEASCWAKAILLDPEKKTYYQQRAKAWKLPNAYTAALKDYMRNRQAEVATAHKRESAVTIVPAKLEEATPFVTEIKSEFNNAQAPSPKLRRIAFGCHTPGRDQRWKVYFDRPPLRLEISAAETTERSELPLIRRSG